MAGLVVGSVVGALVAPPITRALSPQPGGANQPLIAAGIFLACLLIIQGIGTAVGFRARMATMRTRFATWDSVAGTSPEASGFSSPPGSSASRSPTAPSPSSASR